MQHYTEIFVDPECLPRIDAALAKTPGYRDNLLASARHGLKPYLACVASMRGVADRDYLYAALEDIMDTFLDRFWDMPAAPDGQYAHPWGYALQSLYVACAEAEQASLWKPSYRFEPHEERRMKNLGGTVLLHFAKGLIWNAPAFFMYGLRPLNGKGREFDPCKKDSVLTFKLACPEYREEWRDRGIDCEACRLLRSFDFIWKSCIQDADHDGLVHNVLRKLKDETLASFDASLDRTPLPHGENHTEDRFLDGLKRYFNEERDTANPHGHVFRFTDKWTAADAGQFLEKLRAHVDGVYSLEGVRGWLLRKGYMAGTAVDWSMAARFKVKSADGKSTAKERMKLCFIDNDFLRQACSEIEVLTGEIVLCLEDNAVALRICKGDKTVPADEMDPLLQLFRESTEKQHVAAESRAESMENWPAILLDRLERYVQEDLEPGSGWLLITADNAYSPIIAFYNAIIAEAPDTRDSVERICQELESAGLLVMPHTSGPIEFIAPGGKTSLAEGDFFELNIPEDTRNAMLAVLYSES